MLMSVFVLTGCFESSDYVTLKMDVSTKSLKFPSSGGSESFTITSNTIDLKVEVSGNASSWLKVLSFPPSDNGTVTLSANPNLSVQSRVATITVSGKGVKEPATIDVTMDGANPVLSVTPETLRFATAGESKVLTIESNSNWEIINNASWFNIEPLEGEGDLTVTVKAIAEPIKEGRKTPITIKSKDVPEERTVNIEQEAAFISISPASLEFDAEGGQNVIQISSNISWEHTDKTPSGINTCANCITFSPSRGSNNQPVTVTVVPNPTTSVRYYHQFFYQISERDFGQTIIVTQKGATPILTVPQKSLNFTAAGGQQSFTITSNIDWSAVSNASWLTLSKVSGSSNDQVTATAAANTSTSERTARITVSGGGLTQIIEVTQAGVTTFLTVSTSSLSFPYAGEQQSFDIVSNTSWTVVSDATSWLTVSPSSGTNNHTVNVTAANNPSESERTAEITVNGVGTTHNISVTQSGLPKGTISFWVGTDVTCGNIEVTLAGVGTQTITLHYSGSGNPGCGAAGTATFSDLPYGRYSYTATCGGDSRVGNITLDRSCLPMRLLWY